jgi:hypothetical protein
MFLSGGFCHGDCPKRRQNNSLVAAYAILGGEQKNPKSLLQAAYSQLPFVKIIERLLVMMMLPFM